jgi:hypothetical protein
LKSAGTLAACAAALCAATIASKFFRAGGGGGILSGGKSRVRHIRGNTDMHNLNEYYNMAFNYIGGSMRIPKYEV